MEKKAKISHFWAIFHRIFLFLAPNNQLISALFDKNQIYTSKSALFSLKNYQKWEILTIISILPYTDGFFGSIFLYFYMICQNAPPQACQKVGEEWI